MYKITITKIMDYRKFDPMPLPRAKRSIRNSQFGKNPVTGKFSPFIKKISRISY